MMSYRKSISSRLYVCRELLTRWSSAFKKIFLQVAYH